MKKILALLLTLLALPGPAWAISSASPPSSIPEPWGLNAGPSYITAVPTASQIGVTPGRASFNDGFPPLTFTPVGAGGVPPFGADFNGIFNQITAGLQFTQAGWTPPFSTSYSAQIGGYPKGAVVPSSNRLGLFWLSLVENNVSNPDAGGANWSAIIQQHGRQAYTAAATNVFNTPSGVTVVRVRGCWGGGGGGGGAVNNADFGASGGGGEYREGLILVTAGGTLTVVTGAGGNAGSTGGTPGTAGADTTITDSTLGLLMRCKAGGLGGGSNGGGASSAFGAAGTGGSGGDLAVPGDSGGIAFIISGSGAVRAGGGVSFGGSFHIGLIISGSTASGGSGSGPGVGGGGGVNTGGGAAAGGAGNPGAVVLEW